MPIYPQSYSLRDARGRVGWIKTYINWATLAGAAGQGSALAGVLPGATNAALQSARGPYTTAPTAPTYGAALQWAGIDDVVRLFMRTAAGTIFKFDIPAPRSAMFLADGETGLLSSGALKTIGDRLVTSHFCDRDGHDFLALVFAVRTRRRDRRHLSIYQKNALLTGPNL
jgi:hypothetical protein